jgi:hypothetical protein
MINAVVDRYITTSYSMSSPSSQSPQACQKWKCCSDNELGMGTACQVSLSSMRYVEVDRRVQSRCEQAIFVHHPAHCIVFLLKWLSDQDLELGLLHVYDSTVLHVIPKTYQYKTAGTPASNSLIRQETGRLRHNSRHWSHCARG